MAIESKGPKISCDIKDQPDVPEWATASNPQTNSDQSNLSSRKEQLPFDLYQKQAENFPICWEINPPGNKRYFGQRPLFSIENFRATIAPGEVNPSEIFYVITALGTILTYSRYFGSQQFKTTQRFQSGNALRIDGGFDSKRNITVREASFTDYSASPPINLPVTVQKLHGKGLFSFTIPGIAVLKESFTIDEPRQGDVATSPRVLLAPNQPHDFFLPLQPEEAAQQFFTKPKSMDGITPRPDHVELEVQKGTNKREQAILRKWLIYLDNGDVVRVHLKQDHHGEGNYEISRASVLVLSSDASPAINSIPLSIYQISQKGSGSKSATNTPTFELRGNNYPYLIRFQLTATGNGNTEDRIITTDHVSVLVNPRTNNNFSLDLSRPLNLQGVLKLGKKGVALTPTPDQLGKLIVTPPELGKLVTLDLHGTIGNLSISPLSPFQIKGRFLNREGKPVFVPELGTGSHDQKIKVLVYDEEARALPVSLEVSIVKAGEQYNLEVDYGSDPLTPHVYQTLTAPFQNLESIGIGSTPKLVTDRLTTTQKELDQNPEGELIEASSHALVFRTGRQILIVNIPNGYQDLIQIILESPNFASELELNKLTGTTVNPLMGERKTEERKDVTLVLENGKWLIRNEEAGQRTVHELHYDSKAGRIQLSELLHEEISLIPLTAEPATSVDREAAREPSFPELAGFDRETTTLLEKPVNDRSGEVAAQPLTAPVDGAMCEATPAISEVTPSTPSASSLMTSVDAVTTEPPPAPFAKVVEIPVVHFGDPSAEASQATLEMKSVNGDAKALLITFDLVIDGKKINLSVRRVVQPDRMQWSYQPFKATIDGSKAKKFEHFPNKEGQGLRLVLPDGRQLILSSESIRKAEAGYRGAAEAVPALTCDIKDQLMVADATTNLQTLEAASLTEKAVADRKAAIEATEAAKATALAKQAESNKISVEIVQFPNNESFGGTLELLNHAGKISTQKNYQYRLTWQDKAGEHSVEFTIFRRGYQLFPHNVSTIDHIRFSKVDGTGFYITPEGAVRLHSSHQEGVSIVIPPEFLADLEFERMRDSSGLKKQITLFSSEAEMQAVHRFCATDTYLRRLEELDRKRTERNATFRKKAEALGIPKTTIDAILSEADRLTGGTSVKLELRDPMDVQNPSSSTDPETTLTPGNASLLEAVSTMTMDRKAIALPITLFDGLTSRQFDGKLESLASVFPDPKDPNTKSITYLLHLPRNQQITFTVYRKIVGNRTNYELVIADISGWAISKAGLSLNFENLPMGGMEFKLSNHRVLHLDPGVLDLLEDGETSTNIGYVTLRHLPKSLPVVTPTPTPEKVKVEKTAPATVCEAPPIEVATIAITPVTPEVATPAQSATDTAAVCIAEPDLPAKPVMTFNAPIAHDIEESTRASRRTSIQLQMLKEEQDSKGNNRYSFRLTLDNGDRIDFQGSFGQTVGESPSNYFKLATSIYSAADGSAPTAIKGYLDITRTAADITVFPLPGKRTLRIHPHALDIAIDPQPYHQEKIGRANNNFLSIIDPSLSKEAHATSAAATVSEVKIVKKLEQPKQYEISFRLSDETLWVLNLSNDIKIVSAYTKIDGRRVSLIRGEGRQSILTLTHPKTGLVASFYPWRLIRKFIRDGQPQDPFFVEQIGVSKAPLPKTTPFELDAPITNDLSKIHQSTLFERVSLEEIGREFPYDPSSSRTYRLKLPESGTEIVITGSIVRNHRLYKFAPTSCLLFQGPDTAPIDIINHIFNRTGFDRYSHPLQIPVETRDSKIVHEGRKLRVLPSAFQIASGDEELRSHSTALVIYQPSATALSGPTSNEAAPISEDPRPSTAELPAEPPVRVTPPPTPEETPPPVTAQSIEPETLVRPDDSKVVKTGVTYGEGSTDVVAHVSLEFKSEEKFFKGGLEYSKDTFVLYLNETEGVEIVVQRKISFRGRMYTPISAVAYSSNPEEIGELKIEVNTNSFTLTLKDGGRIKLLPGLLVAAIKNPGTTTSKPLINILMPEENPSTLICKKPSSVPPLEPDKPEPTQPAVKPEKTKATTPLLYETEEGLIEARRRVAEQFGLNPELLYLPPDPKHSFPGMRIEPAETGGLNAENEEGTLYSYTYRKGDFTLKVYFAPKEVRRGRGRQRVVPVKAEAIYAGHSGSIPVKEVYSLEGRYYIALDGSFKGMVFYIDRFHACRELSLHMVGEKIAELHGLKPIDYHPRNEYPIHPTGPVLEVVDAQVASNRGLLGREVNACISPMNFPELPPTAAGKASPGGMSITPIRSEAPKPTPAEPSPPTAPYTPVPSESTTVQRIQNRNAAAAALGFEAGIIDINLKYKDFYGVTMIAPEEEGGNSVYALGNNFTLQLKIDTGKAGQTLLPIRNLQATYYGEAIPVTQFIDQNNRTWIKFGGRLEGVVWIFDPFSVSEYEGGKFNRPRLALVRASHPKLMNQLEIWAGHPPSSSPYSGTQIDLNKPADQKTFLEKGFIAQLQRSEAVVKELLLPASSAALSEGRLEAICETATKVEPTQLICEPEADFSTTTPITYPEVVRQQIALAESALRESIREVMVSTDKNLSRRSAKMDAVVALIKGHPYHPVLQGCILAIQETYQGDPGRQTSVLWNFFNESLSHSNDVSFNAPNHVDAIERIVSRAIGKLEEKEEADHEQLVTLKERAAKKEKEAREEMRKLIEEMMKEKR